MPTLRHHEVARHILEVVDRDGPHAPSDVRERWYETSGPGDKPEGAFYEDVVRMLQTPGRYVVLDDDGRLSLTDEGKKVAQGGAFILGR